MMTDRWEEEGLPQGRPRTIALERPHTGFLIKGGESQQIKATGAVGLRKRGDMGTRAIL